MHLNPLYRKLVAEIVFKAETPLSVSIGGQEMLRQVLRVRDMIIIPATTWKGVFRAIAERLAKTMELQGIERLAVKLYRETTKGITYTPTDHDAEWETFLSEFKAVVKNEQTKTPSYNLSQNDIMEFLNDMYAAPDEVDIEDKAARYLAYKCPIGRLFGNQVLAGKIRFTDTILEIEQTHFRPGIGINRRAGKVKENILYYIESIPSGTDVTLRFIADNLLPEHTDTILFEKTLQFVEKMGVQIGTRKSAGMGQLIVKDVKRREIDLRSDTNLSIIRPFKPE